MVNEFYYKTTFELTDAASKKEYLLVAPALPVRIYSRILLYAGDAFTMDLYEDTTTSNDGTSVTFFNVNRVSAETQTMLSYHTPTLTGDGTLLWTTKTAANKSITGVSSKLNYEILLKSGSKYMWRVTKNGAGTSFVDLDLWWIEHTPI
ncbi:MAG: hypothetical protein WC783_00700 [Candidatus Paceibacterota bacterium]|jgi:hypothetical protein